MKHFRAVALAALAALVGFGACTTDEQPELAQVSQQMAVCAAGPTVYGIDVSRFQGDINWDLVASSGVKFAFIQISRSLTDIDAKFAYNWRRAREVGILRGAYQRFQPDQDVIGQAELFVQKLGPYVTGDLPPVLDVEDAKGLSATQIADRVRQWVTYVEQKVGLRPIIYTGYYFWKDSVASADFSDHPLWIANYGTNCPLVPDKWTNWAIHQYSSTANVPGITANTCDVNKFNGTLAELKALAVMPACGDSTCNGDETVDSCAADCEPCQVIASPGSAGARSTPEGSAESIDTTDASRIVDDSGACFSAGGNPMYMRTENAGFGSSLRWTHATDAATPANFGKWSLYFAAAGRYRVEAHTPAPFNGSKQTVYTVHHGEAPTRVMVDQSAVDGWNPIGEFDFVAGAHGQSIRLDDNTGEPNDTSTQIVFDALRFTPLDAPQEDPQMEAGCAAARGDSSLLLALMLVVGTLFHGAHTRPGRRAPRRDAR